MHSELLVFYGLYFSVVVFFFFLLFSSLKKTRAGLVQFCVILHMHSGKQLLSQIDYALKSQGRQRECYHHFVNKEPRHREIKWFTQGHPEHPVKAKNWTQLSRVSIKWFDYEIKGLRCIPDISPLRHGNKTFFRLGSTSHRAPYISYMAHCSDSAYPLLALGFFLGNNFPYYSTSIDDNKLSSFSRQRAEGRNVCAQHIQMTT